MENIKSQSNSRVFVGVSGGVDSSVSLALLKGQGFDVVGVFIKTWQPNWIACTWREERRDAIRVCASLDVPFVELDLEESYRVGVAEYMVREYQAGRTPNPDVMCNREVKFGGFLRYALDHGADYVATGHYARIASNDGKFQLQRGIDNSKDQSYFLWMLTQDELAHILFPVGSYQKSEVRSQAETYHLPTATKKDSQGICFIGDIDMKDFLKHYVAVQNGDVLDTEGRVIGNHQGARFFTLGERHGFTVYPQHKGTLDDPYYVVAKNIEDNTITVDHSVSWGSRESISLLSVNNQGELKEGDTFDVQIRYRGECYGVVMDSYDSSLQTAQVRFLGDSPLVAPGQSVVFYRGENCLGGGIVQ